MQVTKKESSQSIAQFLISEHADIGKLMGRADEESISSNQDWEAGSTTYEFIDGSKLFVSGMDATAL